MRAHVQRTETDGDALFGMLYLDGVYECLTLERLGVEIPAGTYPLILTTSTRVRKGALWSPRKDSVLPLVDRVPGRDGIRFHSGNVPAHTDGCLLLGTVRLGASIHNSRTALTTFMDKLVQARKAATLVIEDPKPIVVAG